MPNIPFYISEEQKLVSQNSLIKEQVIKYSGRVERIPEDIISDYNSNIDKIHSLRQYQPMTEEEWEYGGKP